MWYGSKAQIYKEVESCKPFYTQTTGTENLNSKKKK